ncbi:MAG: AraC family transcriptional regulator [Kiloniellales bacterium]|nr:AraC family transcriptional regulator [Kiloniellales bacterium]
MSLNPKAFIQVAAIIGLPEALRRAGCNPDQICKAVGLRPAELRDPDASIPLHAYLNLLEVAADRSGDDCFGLRFGASYDPSDYGALGFVALNSPTVGAGLLNVGRYLGVMRDHCRVMLEVEDSMARLRYRLAVGSVGLRRQDAEMALGRICGGIRLVLGSDWAPSAVLFEHPAPADHLPHREIFGAEVRFGQAMNAMIFDQEVLEAEIPTADSRLLRILEGFLEEELSRRRADPDLVQRVRRQVLDAIGTGVPGIAEVASAAGMSIRTLQRRLGEQGLTYNKLVDDLRHELALQYLEAREVSISEIAFLLGYSEASAFDRAFRRRSGLSPLEFRRRLGSAVQPA